MPTVAEVIALLSLLEVSYGRQETVVRAPQMTQQLALLRALEYEGLVQHKRVGLEVRWVCSPAGAIWLRLQRLASERPLTKLDLDHDILMSPTYAWMSRSEALDAVSELGQHGFAYVGASTAGSGFGILLLSGAQPESGVRVPGTAIVRFQDA